MMRLVLLSFLFLILVNTGLSFVASFRANTYPSSLPPKDLEARKEVQLHLYKGIFQPNNNTELSKLNSRHSAKDWLYNFQSLPRSVVLKDIRGPVLSVTIWSTLISVVRTLLIKSGKGRLQSLATDMCVSTSVHSFLISALSLLLVFRTNSAYQRFNEGRKIWENILSVSRNLSRMIQLYSNEVGIERKRKIINFMAAYPYLLRHHIRTGCLCDEEAETLIKKNHHLLLREPSHTVLETRYEGDGGGVAKNSAKKPVALLRECWVDRRKLPWRLFDRDLQEIISVTENRPLWVCDRIGREIMSIPYGPNFSSRERLALLGKVEKLTNAIGQCERIHQTAVPLNYARHLLRGLTIWLFTLPFALVKDIGILTGPATGIIAWLLFGVYQIGYSIEDPFQGSLRLSILCDAIRQDVVIYDKENKYSYLAVKSVPNSKSNLYNGTSKNTHRDVHNIKGCWSASKEENNYSQMQKLRNIAEVSKLKELIADTPTDLILWNSRHSINTETNSTIGYSIERESSSSRDAKV